MLKKCTKREGKAESKCAKMFDRNSNVCEEMHLLFHAQRASVFALLTWVHKSNGRRGLSTALGWRNPQSSGGTRSPLAGAVQGTPCAGHWGKPGFSKILLNPANKRLQAELLEPQNGSCHTENPAWGNDKNGGNPPRNSSSCCVGADDALRRQHHLHCPKENLV